MKSPDFVNIIYTGDWNYDIFNPSWVSTELLNQEPGKDILLQFDPVNQQTIYVFDDILLLPKTNIFELRFAKKGSLQYKHAIDLHKNIILKLPNPLNKGFGINIKYKFEKGEKNKITNSIDYRNNAFDLAKVNLKQKIDSAHDLNIIIDFEDNNHIIHFNFHYHKYRNLSKSTIIDKIKLTKSYL